MAQNITLLGASYSDVPAVTLPKTGGGTARFDDASVTTATASDVAQGKVFLAADGTITTGTNSGGGGGLDIPTFTETWSNDWETLISVTCDKTFAECLAYINNGITFASLSARTQDGSEVYENSVFPHVTMSGANEIRYTVIYSGAKPEYDIKYESNGTISKVSPSAMIDTLNITQNGAYPYDGIKFIEEVNVDVPSTTISPLSVTTNGTYTAPSGTAYSPVTVNVSGGGGASSWTKVAETSYQVSTTSTSAETVATWETGHSEIWTSNKIVYIRIRDTAGKRSGYFYGTDAFYLNYIAKNSPDSSTNTSSGLIISSWSVSSSGNYAWRYGYNTTGYGVYPDQFYTDGKIRIRSRYNGTYSLTINGTYKVEVYLLDPAGGVPIFT